MGPRLSMGSCRYMRTNWRRIRREFLARIGLDEMTESLEDVLDRVFKRNGSDGFAEFLEAQAMAEMLKLRIEMYTPAASDDIISFGDPAHELCRMTWDGIVINTKLEKVMFHLFSQLELV